MAFPTATRWSLTIPTFTPYTKRCFKRVTPASVDLLQNLKEHEPNPHLKELFDRRYSDILLIFDLDPQDPLFSVVKITEMASYFVESSDMGKLYLNYPMVEAYYHMKSIPDPEFDSYTVSLEELTGHTYKGRVNRRKPQIMTTEVWRGQKGK